MLRRSEEFPKLSVRRAADPFQFRRRRDGRAAGIPTLTVVALDDDVTAAVDGRNLARSAPRGRYGCCGTSETNYTATGLMPEYRIWCRPGEERGHWQTKQSGSLRKDSGSVPPASSVLQVKLAKTAAHFFRFRRLSSPSN